MLLIKQRIYAFLIVLISTAVLFWTWHDAARNGGYYLKAATFAPVGIVAGVFLVFFPEFFGKPETARKRIVVLSIFGVGLLLGLCNIYLIDPNFFSFLIH